jgi:phosphatidylserine/phosphatidylglycerophosphate/cardiolipin synthase-like enzyme
VFSVALSLALATFATILPASSVASGAAIAVCFTPEEDCAAFAVRAINNAERQILIGAYGLTTGSGIVEALARTKDRGVDVRLIADKTPPCERESGIEPLARGGAGLDRRSGADRARQDDGNRRRRHTDGFDELGPSERQRARKT